MPDRLGRTPLHHAVLSGIPGMVEWTLGQKDLINIDAQDGEGNTAYHLAVASRNEAIMGMLNRTGANREIKNRKKQTAEQMSVGLFSKNPLVARKQKFEAAVSSDDFSTVRSMLGSYPSLLTDDPDAVLALAVEAGAYLTFLLCGNLCIETEGNDSKVRGFISRTDRDGKALIHHLAEKGIWTELAWFIEHGADVDQSPPGRTGPTALSIAVANNDEEGVLRSLDHKADARRHFSSERGGGKVSLLAIAQEHRASFSICEALLYAGAAPTADCEYSCYKAEIISATYYACAAVLLEDAELQRSDLDCSHLDKSAAVAMLQETFGFDLRHQCVLDVDVIAEESFHSLFAKPVDELMDAQNQALRNQQVYQESKAALFRAVLDPVFDRFNALAGSRGPFLVLNQDIQAFEQLESGVYKALSTDYKRLIFPHLQVIDSKGQGKSVGKLSYDYASLTVGQYQAIDRSVTALEKSVVDLQSSCQRAHRTLWERQVAVYRTLAKQITEFKRLMEVVPADQLDSSGWSYSSLRSQAVPCQTAIGRLIGFGEGDSVAEFPELVVLAENAPHLETLNLSLEAINKKLKQAEHGHLAQEQKQSKAAQERARKDATARVVSEVKAINVLVSRIGEVLRGSRSPLVGFVLTLSDAALPTESEIYSEALKALIRVACTQKRELCAFMPVGADQTNLGLLSTHSREAQHVPVDKVGDFFDKAGELRESLGKLLPLLQKALHAEHRQQELETKEAEMRGDLLHQIEMLNKTLVLIGEALADKPVEAVKLEAVATFRGKLGCKQGGVSPVMPASLPLT